MQFSEEYLSRKIQRGFRIMGVLWTLFFFVILKVSATTSFFANAIRVSEWGRLRFSQKDLKWALNQVGALYLQRGPRLSILTRWSLSSQRKGNDRKLSLTLHKSPSLRKLYCHQYHLEHLTIANQKLQFQLATISLWYVFYYLCYNFMLSYDREF